MTSRPFVAEFRGRCEADCGTPVAEGDQVVYLDDDLMHEACARDVAATTPGQPLGRLTAPCPTCRLFHAGECF